MSNLKWNGKFEIACNLRIKYMSTKNILSLERKSTICSHRQHKKRENFVKLTVGRSLVLGDKIKYLVVIINNWILYTSKERMKHKHTYIRARWIPYNLVYSIVVYYFNCIPWNKFDFFLSLMVLSVAHFSMTL